MNGTHPAGGHLARTARRLGYRTRTASWSALCTLCALLGPTAVAAPAAVAGAAAAVDD
ncbi:hypothetical protein [Kitasatospora phosalacinea]|uniref:Uncharacterized protein n=1 Tax=Kitasatospora phosalacinea TaxID=2065 RepID=A0A9W6PLX2_9ACTN|nr:hypothetical protein [Kitasatospora phosalacinea]GLW57332.1 hypothetical protein Kpho01_53430 [Kitasatospora phosalacinea]